MASCRRCSPRRSILFPACMGLPMTRPSTVSFLLSLAACGGGAVAEFGPAKTLSKDQRPTVWEASNQDRFGLKPMGPVGGAGAGKARQWIGDTPSGWESLPANPSKFRDAQWKLTGQSDADCYLTAGVGGGVAFNLSRWYTTQFGIATVPALEALPQVAIAGRTGRLAELTGTFNQKPGQAALIAFYAEGEQVTSLKFTGPESVVLGNKDKFLALASSLRAATVSPDPQAPPIQPGQPMPDTHPPIGDAPHPGAASQATAPFSATAPSGWTAKAGSARLLHHEFGAGGEVYVGQLGGGLKPTLDIWRGELELQPMSEAEFTALPKVAFLGEDSVLLDLSGNFRSMSGKQIPSARVLVAARSDGNSITFVKLVGTAADVATQVDAFRQFCASVRRAP